MFETSTHRDRFFETLLFLSQLSFAGCLMLMQKCVFSQDDVSTRELPTSHISRTSNVLKLALPIDCSVGKDCQILAYVDHDPGPEFHDFSGGRQTYDGHDGTDFGIADERIMRKGVAVRAAASGTVARVRDGIADKRVENQLEARDVSDIGCGNAVAIEHRLQWETYYCHLRNGSLAVRPGMRVEKGAVLGLVGSSGLASYPHLHFGAIHQGKKIDPFLGPGPVKEGQPTSQALWEEAISYVPAGLISAGFSDQKPDINSVWQGISSRESLTTQSEAIIFWVHPFGVIAGDVEQLRLLDPDGKAVVESNAPIRSANRINRLSLVGKRNSQEAPISAGTWQGTYQLRRNQQLLIDIKQEIEVARN